MKKLNIKFMLKLASVPIIYMVIYIVAGYLAYIYIWSSFALAFIMGIIFIPHLQKWIVPKWMRYISKGKINKNKVFDVDDDENIELELDMIKDEEV